MIGLSLLRTAHPDPFQRKTVRPSSRLYPTFSLAMRRSQSFASAPGDSGALFGLAFAPARCLKALNLAAEEQLVGSLCKRHAVTTCAAPTACRRTVSGTVSPRGPRCFSPFPHGTRSLSVSRECLALAEGAAGFGRDSSGPALLRIRPRGPPVSRTGLSPCPAGLSRPLPLPARRPLGVLLPRPRLDGTGLGSAAFAHHYSRYHFCFLFLPLLRCFSSGGSPPRRADAGPPARRVAPFGHPGVEAHLRLAPAFRSLSRPSSPPGAKASTVRPWILRVSERHNFLSVSSRYLVLLLCSLLLVSPSSMSKNLAPKKGASRGG